MPMARVRVEKKDQQTPLSIIAHRVRGRRREQGVTRAAVSVAAAVSVQVVDRVERGEPVMLSSLLAICEALGLSLEVR
jgi:transcriptional regulator with XRE-family HTH domain